MAINEKPLEIFYDRELCNDCGLCKDVCPLVRSIGFDSPEDPAARSVCIRCGHCISICPNDAIRIDSIRTEFPTSEIPSSEEMLQLIKSRRSVRNYDKRKLSGDVIKTLIEAVKYSPTGHNTGRNALFIIQSRKILDSISQICIGKLKKISVLMKNPILRPLFRKMMGKESYAMIKKLLMYTHLQEKMRGRGDDPVLFNAPALLLFLSLKSENMSRTEADLAAQNVALLAPTLKLGTCYAGLVMLAFSGPDSSAIGKIVNIPRGYKVYNAMVIGYEKKHITRIPNRRDLPVYLL